MTSAVAPAMLGRAPAAPPSHARVAVRWLIDHRAQLLAGVAAAAITIENMPETMPYIGTLIAVAPLTYALATAAGTLVVAAAPLLTLRKLRRTDISATLRVVE